MATVDFIDPVEAAVNALRAYYETEIPNLVAPLNIEKYVEAHPEHGVRWAASDDKMALSFLTTNVGYEYTAPREVFDDTDESKVYYRYGFLDITLLMDLWSRYRAPIAVGRALVEKASHPDLPWSTAFVLTAPGYYGQQFSTEINTMTPMWSSGTAMQGVFNTQWSCRLRMHLVTDHDKVALEEVRAQMTYQLGQNLNQNTLIIN